MNIIIHKYISIFYHKKIETMKSLRNPYKQYKSTKHNK